MPVTEVAAVAAARAPRRIGRQDGPDDARSPGPTPMSATMLSMAVVQGLTVLVGLLRAKGLALVLGPAAFGVVSTTDQVVVTVATLGALALPFTAMKFMARSHTEGDAAFRRSAAGFLRLAILLGVLATAVGSAVIAWHPSTFGADLAAYQRVLRVAILGAAPTVVLMVVVNTLAAARRPAVAAGLNLLATAGLALAATAGAWWRGVVGVYELSVTAAALATVLALRYLAGVLGVRLDAPHTGILAALRGEPTIAGYSLCFYVTFASISIMMLLVRTVVLSRLGEVAVGQLQAVFSVALTVGAVLYPLSNLYLGPLANSRAPAAEKARVAEEFVGRMLLLLLAAVTPVLLFPGGILRVLFTAAFVPVAAVLWLFVLWQCVFQIAYVYQQILIGLDDVVVAATALLAGCALAIALAPALTTRMGLGGVAVALASGMTVWGAAVAIRLRARHGVRVPRRVLLRLGGVLLVVAVLGRLFGTAPNASAAALAARLAAAAGVAALLVWLSDPQERNLKLWLAVLRPGSGST